MDIREYNLKLGTYKEANALFAAMGAGDLKKVRRIVTKNPKILKWYTSWPTLLHHAAEISTVPVVKYLLSLGFDVNENPYKKEGHVVTPIIFAAQRRRLNPGTEAMVKFLVKQG